MEVRMRGSFETPIAFVMTVLASLVGPQLVAADMTVHFINVGQGGGVLVQKDGKNLLYDCGDTFAGDCEATCEREVSATSKIGSFVLNVGHHGASTASSTLFLSKVKPKIAVIQAGVNNQYGHPKPDVITRLLKAGVTREQIYRTDKQSSIVVVSDGLTVEVDTEK
jgi:beta-lactamase superfamily II metal-dependent hydrolase